MHKGYAYQNLFGIPELAAVTQTSETVTSVQTVNEPGVCHPVSRKKIIGRYQDHVEKYHENSISTPQIIHNGFDVWILSTHVLTKVL